MPDPTQESAKEPAQDPVQDPEQHPGHPPFEATGHDGVDRVLGTLDGIELRGVHEHVAAFEEVHAALRRALDGTLEDASDPSRG